MGFNNSGQSGLLFGVIKHGWEIPEQTEVYSWENNVEMWDFRLPGFFFGVGLSLAASRTALPKPCGAVSACIRHMQAEKHPTRQATNMTWENASDQ